MGVTPRLMEELAVTGGLIGGPVVGAAVAVLHNLVKKPFEKGTRIEYAVKGSWDNPAVTRLHGPVVAPPVIQEGPLAVAMIFVWPMLAGLALGVSPDAVAVTLTLPVAEIEPVRTERLAAHAPLRGFLLTFEERGRAVLCIRHAGGEAPTRRAEALRDALVALGIPSARLVLEPAAAGVDELVLEIVVTGDTGCARPFFV